MPPAKLAQRSPFKSLQYIFSTKKNITKNVQTSLGVELTFDY